MNTWLTTLRSKLNQGESYEDLEPYFQQIASLFPHSLVAHYYLSLIYTERSNWEQAISELSNTLAILIGKEEEEDIFAEICQIRLLRARVSYHAGKYQIAEEDTNWIISQKAHLDREILAEALNIIRLSIV